MKKILNNKELLFLFILMAFGAFLRFYNLDWGAPFYFNPDERNIAAAVSQLNFPTQMNPHFFAYGSFPIYLIFFAGIVKNVIFQTKISDSMSQVSFENAILISRFMSALLSTLLIPVLYFIAKEIKDKTAAITTSIFSILSVGFIQFAHFGTFETVSAFFASLLFFISVKIYRKMTLKNIILSGVILGFLAATKISNLVFFPIPLISIFLNARIEKKKYKKIFLKLFSVLTISAITFFIFSPFSVFDFKSFLFSMNYESSVALGTLPVFYTQEFFGTVPIAYQFLKIYPFLLNPSTTIIFVVCLIYLIYIFIKNKNYYIFLLLIAFLLIFLSQAFFFAKWTRYVLPTLPFIFLIIGFAISDFRAFLKKNLINYLLIFITIINFVFAISYFITVYAKIDTRVDAASWARKHVKNDAKILSEVYDLGILPFNRNFPIITLFNFYDLDTMENKDLELSFLLKTNEVAVFPSQRIIDTRLSNPKQFPKGYKFYNNIFNQKLGFIEIYETPCDIFCKITYLGNPVFSFEETASVFDRPTLFIFEKKL